MTGIDIDPFGDNDKPDTVQTKQAKIFHFTTGGGSTWEQDCEQETLFRRMTREVLEVRVEALYQLSHNKTHQRLEPCLSMFEIDEDDGGLYYRGKPLTNPGDFPPTSPKISSQSASRSMQNFGGPSTFEMY